MLDHLHVEDHVEPLARRRHILGKTRPVVDGKLLLDGMDACRLDVLLGRVDPHHIGTQPRHRFAEQSAAAADIEESQTGKRPPVERVARQPATNLLLDIGQPHRIEDMQNPEFSLRIPPFGGHFREFLDFRRVERRGGGGGHLVIQFSLSQYCISRGPHL